MTPHLRQRGRQLLKRAMIINGLLAPATLWMAVKAHSYHTDDAYLGYFSFGQLFDESLINVPVNAVAPAAAIAAVCWLWTQVMETRRVLSRQGKPYHHTEDTAIHGLCLIFWAGTANLLCSHYEVGYGTETIALGITMTGVAAVMLTIICTPTEAGKPKTSMLGIAKQSLKPWLR